MTTKCYQNHKKVFLKKKKTIGKEKPEKGIKILLKKKKM